MIELPTIVDAFAESFDHLPLLYAVRDDYRFLVTTGRLVRAVTVIGQRVADDTIVLFGIDIDA